MRGIGELIAGRLRSRRGDGLPDPADRARGARAGDALTAAVEPVLLPDWHLLASVEEEYNAVYMKTAASGDLSLFGKGAGALPTATAVLGDLIDLAQDNSVQWPEPRATALVPPRRRAATTCGVSAEPHPGLARRVDSIVRRAGLDGAEPRVARRAARHAPRRS